MSGEGYNRYACAYWDSHGCRNYVWQKGDACSTCQVRDL